MTSTHKPSLSLRQKADSKYKVRSCKITFINGDGIEAINKHASREKGGVFYRSSLHGCGKEGREPTIYSLRARSQFIVPGVKSNPRRPAYDLRHCTGSRFDGENTPISGRYSLDDEYAPHDDARASYWSRPHVACEITVKGIRRKTWGANPNSPTPQQPQEIHSPL